jgi:hypothetical protein
MLIVAGCFGPYMGSLAQYLKTPGSRVFLAPNTSDQDLIERAKQRLVENGAELERIQINYNTQELAEGDLFVSYDPPDLVVRVVYSKKPNGIVKMKSTEMIRL